jgi:hypothetical protein
LIRIVVGRDGKITAGGMVPGQVAMLTLPNGECYRITRFGTNAIVHVERDKGRKDESER